MTQHLHGGKHKARTLTALTLSVLLGATLTTGCTKKPEAATQTPAPAKTAAQPQQNPENPTQNTSNPTPQDHPLPKGFRDTWSTLPTPQPDPEFARTDHKGIEAAGKYCLALYILGGYTANPALGLAQSIPESRYAKQLQDFASESKEGRILVEGGLPHVEWVTVGETIEHEYAARLRGKKEPVRIFSRTTGELVEHPEGKFDITLVMRRVNNEWKCVNIGKEK